MLLTAQIPTLRLTRRGQKPSLCPLASGGYSSAWLEPQIVDLAVAGSNPVSHPTASLPILLSHRVRPLILSNMLVPLVRPFRGRFLPPFSACCGICYDRTSLPGSVA